MSKPYPWYFVVDGWPVKVASKDEVLAMDPSTGAMVPNPSYRDRLPGGGEVDKNTYQELLDEVRQPILERYATAPLQWKLTGDGDVPYRVAVDGHELTIRMGDFPAEALYLMHIDAQGVYAIDDWPNAWKKPGQT